jgi:[protein-PII] uridylyltransferase
MGIVPTIRPSVVAAKSRLAEGREKLKRQHAEGSPGIQVCACLTDLLDGVVLELYRAAREDLGGEDAASCDQKTALVACGGYGRRDVAPYSDVDLLLLHQPSASSQVQSLSRRLVMDVSDVGLQLGFSVRTPAQACSLARRDPVIFTSQAEARWLAGSPRLFAQFMRRFRRDTQRRCHAVVNAIDRARREERARYGETVYLLEPNVKRSRGALRDIHMVGWLGFARYGQVDPKDLRLRDALSPEDERTLRKATEFLLRLRNELHFHAAKPEDVLDRREQMRIAQWWGYRDQSGMLPVEQFMRHYFQLTGGVRDIVGNLLATARQRSPMLRVARPLVSHLVEGDFRVGPAHIGATRRGSVKLEGDLVQVLRLMDLANLYDKMIEHRTWKAIREDMTGRTDLGVSKEAARRFLSLLSQTPRLGHLLRRLHELRVLEKLVAGMDHARCLLQFNTYHKYTVDEHCIRAVEYATDLLSDTGLLGDVYRSIQQRAILHLALLIHDLGKGYPDDHSQVGETLALETARRLKLDEHQTETLRFLVHRHLLMSHLAFRRDTGDESVIVQFAAQVGSPEMLRLLFVHTCADLAAVGPDVLNQWKIEILAQLYFRALRHLSDVAPPDVDERIDEVRRLAKETVPEKDVAWFCRQIESLPAAYLTDSSPERLIEDLARLRQLAPDRAVAWARYLSERQAVEYTVGAYERLTRGIFHRLTGALTRHGLQILAAEIHSLADDLILDRFYVQDNDFVGEPPPDRFLRVGKTLVDALENPSDAPPSFRQTWQAGKSTVAESLELMPTRVAIDNSTSQEYTILDVFTHDRIGLLYTMTRTLYELGVSVSIAKISTYLDQVVDVFYVTDNEGQKIEDEAYLGEIRGRLLQALQPR